MCTTLFSHLRWPSLQISTKQGGNSGSPVVHEETGEAIGVHTHGGCSETGGSNSGTRIDRPDFANHVAFLTAVCDSDAQCDAMSPGAFCDSNRECQFGLPPTQSPTPYSDPCGAGELDVSVRVNTDNYASETSWSLVNGCTGATVKSMPGSEPQYANNGAYGHQFCLPEAEYTFTINDSFGDVSSIFVLRCFCIAW